MSSEIFNPNPTIFAPTKSKKSSTYARSHSIWLDDGELDQDDEYDQSDETETIDQDEIFGTSL